ncbi:predicted protein [Nematostella vectensis]|uniref:Uncharacterized protein n=1 Tax=Nematostella vectensis TaxID=45351 RepID=A7STE3_NEMVE|nr:predicted protein [Nematostella vectensis]|eukprot:XP_001625141.1 predicted protein [Nematostella vectensis]
MASGDTIPDTPKPQSGQVPTSITKTTRNRNSNKELVKAETTKSGKSAAFSHTPKSEKDRTSDRDGNRSSNSIFLKNSSFATPPSNNAPPTESNKNGTKLTTKGDSSPSAYTLKVIRESLRAGSVSVTPPEKSPQTPLPPKPTKAQKRKARRAKLEMYLSMGLNAQGDHREESSKTPRVDERPIKIAKDASQTTGTSGVRQKDTVIDRAARPASTPNDPYEVKGVCASESPSLLSTYDIQERINSLSIHPKETRTQKRRRRREKAKLYASLNSLSNDTTPVNDSKEDNTQANVTDIDEAIAKARPIKITEDASPTTGTSGVHQKATVIDRAARPASTPNDPYEVKGVCATEGPSLLSAYDIQERINSLSIHPKETRNQKRRRRREKAKLYASLNSLSNDTTPDNDSKADNTQASVTVIDETIAKAPLNTRKDVSEAYEGLCVSEGTSDASSPSLLSAYDILDKINSLSIHPKTNDKPKETQSQKRRRRREKAKLYASFRALSNDTSPVNESKADNTRARVTEIDETIARAYLNACKHVSEADEGLCTSERTD